MTLRKPYFSEKRITEITRSLRKRVTEHIRQQSEGKLPFYKRIPVTVMEIKHVMVVISRSRNIASLVLKDIREELGKKTRQKVSVSEFCKHTDIPEFDVRQALNLLT